MPQQSQFTFSQINPDQSQFLDAARTSEKAKLDGLNPTVRNRLFIDLSRTYSSRHWAAMPLTRPSASPRQPTYNICQACVSNEHCCCLLPKPSMQRASIALYHIGKFRICYNEEANVKGINYRYHIPSLLH